MDFRLFLLFPLLFRISYSVYELKKMRETTSQNSLKFILMYDIACLLSSHLKVNIILSFFCCFKVELSWAPCNLTSV